MVALNETVMGVGFRVTGSPGDALKARGASPITSMAPPALRPTVYVPLKRGETLTYAEVVARKV